jgi:hypothetical protein
MAWLTPQANDVAAVVQPGSVTNTVHHLTEAAILPLHSVIEQRVVSVCNGTIYHVITWVDNDKQSAKEPQSQYRLAGDRNSNSTVTPALGTLWQRTVHGRVVGGDHLASAPLLPPCCAVAEPEANPLLDAEEQHVTAAYYRCKLGAGLHPKRQGRQR